MKQFIDELKLWIGIWGEKAGLSIVTVVALWDIVWQGARHLFCYSIGVKGVMALLIAVGLIVASKHIQNKMR